MSFSPERLLLYGVTDRAWVGDMSFLEQIEDALKGGVTLLQLREKNLNEAELIGQAVQVKALCSKYGVPLIINDNPEAAIKSGADGVHVGAEDMPIAKIRKLAGMDFIIGATAKTVEQAVQAQADGADYLGVGAVFPSSVKKNAVGITLEKLKEISSGVSIPCAAIGGIDCGNIHRLAGSGISGIAVVSAVFGQEDIYKGTSRLLTRVKCILGREGFDENSTVYCRQ